MRYRSLYDMITYLQNGTNLHIGVLFRDDYGNYMCDLPHRHMIHSGIVCENVKVRSKADYRRCFRCRNLAIKKALENKSSFGGLCINGIYEYTHPVIIDNNVVCIIFIGNILSTQYGTEKIMSKIKENIDLVNTMEKNYTQKDCEAVADLLDAYIRVLLEKFSSKEQSSDTLMKNIKNYINSNLEFDIDISHIAAYFHYNKLYLGRLFKKQAGMSINDYINLQRIEMAKNLLIKSDDSVTTISSKAGFNTVTYFNRLFKRQLSVTPSKYRQLYK